MFWSSFITIILLTAIVAAVLLLGDTFLFVAVIAATITILSELYRAFNYTKKKTLTILGFLPLLFVFVKDFGVLPCMLVAYIACLFAALVLFHGDIRFSDIACIFFTGVVVTSFMWHIVLVRRIQDTGPYLVFTVFIGAWMSDLGAYIVGRKIGTHKLAPRISPEKTIEGVFGGFLGSITGFLCYGYIMSEFFGFHINIYGLWGLGILCAITSQLGDLVASSIKRECKIRNFAHLFPGFGGILDMFDSVLLTAPLIYYFVTYYPIIY